MTVTCIEAAEVTVKGSGKAPGGKKATKFAIPPVKVDATANVSTRLKLRIPKPVQQVLAAAADAGKSAKAKITARATDDQGRSSLDALSVEFKP